MALFIVIELAMCDRGKSVKQINKRDLMYLFICMLMTALVFFLYLYLGIKYVNKESISENKNILIASPLISGPSIGFGIFRILKNRKRIRDDLEFRSHIIFRATFESLIILFPLWGLMKIIGLL